MFRDGKVRSLGALGLVLALLLPARSGFRYQAQSWSRSTLMLAARACPFSSGRRLLLALFLVGCLLPTQSGAQTVPGDAYLCYVAGRVHHQAWFTPVQKTLEDQFRSVLVNVRKLTTFCNPTQTASHPMVHQLGYGITYARVPGQPRFERSDHVVIDQFGQFVVRILSPIGLFAPSASVAGVGDAGTVDTAGVDHFECYQAALAVPTTVVAPPLTIVDDFGQATITIGKITKLCTPVNKNGEDASAPAHVGHWVCRQARLPWGSQFVPRVVSTKNTNFGPAVLVAESVWELCVPAFMDAVPTTTTTTTITSTSSTTTTTSIITSGHIYWTNIGIGRADLDGQNANAAFVTGSFAPVGVAVDSGHIYWADSNGNTIGRADLNGQNANPSFIAVASYPYGVAVDSGHVYWANANGYIGRADLNGQNVNDTFISVVGSLPTGVAVDSGHVYWADEGFASIGRADLNGQNVNQNFIAGAAVAGLGPVFVAVDSSHIYWTTGGTNPVGTVARADLNGQNVNLSFITDTSVTFGVAVDSGHVYWTDELSGSIGRADLNGQNANPSFTITGPAFALAVGP